MLKEIVDHKRYCFHKRCASWEEAIAFSCEPLLRDGSIDERYVQAIIACVHKYGPYIVIAPDIAMPHASECADGVFATAISFMKVEESVCFDESDHDKDARLFFTVAAENHEQHLQNIMELAEELSNEELVQELLRVECAEDFRRVILAYDLK